MPLGDPEAHVWEADVWCLVGGGVFGGLVCGGEHAAQVPAGVPVELGELLQRGCFDDVGDLEVLLGAARVV